MKLIIAGGRDYYLTDENYDDLNMLSGIREVVCGGATGADSCGRQWAESRGILVRMFPADWKVHGRAAGPIRNKQMAEYADAVALFPGGRGTRSMREEATKAGIKIYDFTK